MKVNEIFGPTMQGEGPFAGSPAIFLRVARCNLWCSYCDTPYTWDWTRHDPLKEVKTVPVTEVAVKLNEIGRPGDLLVITGGEPMLQQDSLEELLGLVPFRVQIETNGTRPVTLSAARVEAFVISPHLPRNAGEMKGAVDPAVLAGFAATGKAWFKFVVSTSEDVDDISELCGQVPGMSERVILMPEGRSVDELLDRGRTVAEIAISRGWRFSQRLHVLAWGNERER